MRVVDKKVDKDAAIAEKLIPFAIDDVGNSEADTLLGAFNPGYDFEIIGVQAFAASATAGASVDVKIATTSALSAALDLDADANGARADAVLSGTLASVRGLSTEDINVHVTTDGTGTVEGLVVYVLIRKRGHAGDPGVV